uniref:DNA-directed DNA polymerase n=1 Tax=Tanacetum cinerariifolium TaxID=118510 RepID=A0A6L2JC05_TANCI|nr:DNA-directed DNA polymerase [Tanacetum cinerariifolium]
MLSHVIKQASIKRKDLGRFIIPCDISQLRINNALADLGASISLMPYTMYEKLGLGESKATRMSLELADRSFQYPRGIIENVLIKVDKFVLLIDFVILDMPKDSRVPKILGRPFLATTQAMIDMFNKKITLRVGDDKVIFDVDQSIKRPSAEDDECYGVDDLDDTINAEAQILLASDKSDKFLLKGLEKSINQSDLKSCGSFECKAVDNSNSGEPIRHINYLWVSPIYMVPKKGGMNVVFNDNNELIPSRTVKGWRVCLDYRKLNDANRKDHFPLPFIDKMLERLCGNEYYCFLDRFSRFFQISIALEDQEKTTFTCPYGTFTYRRMMFGLCNAPATFQRCMTIECLLDVKKPTLCLIGKNVILCKQDAKPRLISWVLLLQGFDIEIKDNKGRKVYESGFFWPSIFKDAKDYVMRCDACQRSGDISSRREMPQNNIQIYKERTKRWHDSRLRGDMNFKVGDKVLLFISRFKIHPGKLKSRWYGPNMVKSVYPYRAVEITDKNKINFKVNGQRLKKYQDGHIDTEDKEIVEFEEDKT